MPSVLNWWPITSVMRVVTRNSAGGKKTARKRRTTRSYSFCSGSDRFFGACSVGMIAKWSLIFELSKMRLFGLTHWPLSTIDADCR